MGAPIQRAGIIIEALGNITIITVIRSISTTKTEAVHTCLRRKKKQKKEEAARIERERKKRRRKEISKNVALCSVGAAVTGGTVGVIVNKFKKRKK